MEEYCAKWRNIYYQWFPVEFVNFSTYWKNLKVFPTFGDGSTSSLQKVTLPWALWRWTWIFTCGWGESSAVAVSCGFRRYISLWKQYLSGSSLMGCGSELWRWDLWEFPMSWECPNVRCWNGWFMVVYCYCKLVGYVSANANFCCLATATLEKRGTSIRGFHPLLSVWGEWYTFYCYRMG